MGYMRHHAIVVTGMDCGVGTEQHETAMMVKARQVAIDIFGDVVTPLTPSSMNGYVSFFIPPDGSKEGWFDSRVGDERRLRFVEYLKSQAYDDGSNSLKWVEFYYGTDSSDAGIEDHCGAHYTEVNARLDAEEAALEVVMREVPEPVALPAPIPMIEHTPTVENVSIMYQSYRSDKCPVCKGAVVKMSKGIPQSRICSKGHEWIRNQDGSALMEETPG